MSITPEQWEETERCLLALRAQVLVGEEPLYFMPTPPQPGPIESIDAVIKLIEKILAA